MGRDRYKCTPYDKGKSKYAMHLFGVCVCVLGWGGMKNPNRSFLSRSDKIKPSILGTLLGKVGFMRYTHTSYNIHSKNGFIPSAFTCKVLY